MYGADPPVPRRVRIGRCCYLVLRNASRTSSLWDDTLGIGVPVALPFALALCHCVSSNPAGVVYFVTHRYDGAAPFGM
jgi:hypothetical protein